MPPKARFSREDIVNAALSIVREGGLEALTARTLGKRLGSSACPVFTVFENMEEVEAAMLEAARALYKTYIEKGLAESPAFKGVGTQYIQFSINEPRLFQLLFMEEQEAVPDLLSVLQLIDESYDQILSSITDAYGFTKCEAEKLYRHLWIYSHGIAVLCATKMCHFTEEEISGMLTEVFVGLLMEMKKEKQND